MFLSVFTDELGKDFEDNLALLQVWGANRCDLRSHILGKKLHELTTDDLARVKELLALHGLKVGALESSVAKVHLPDRTGQAAEAKELEGVIRAADALDCRLVRAFHFWQPEGEEAGTLDRRPDRMAQVLEMFEPLARRAKEAGLTLAFENCGETTEEVHAFLDALKVPGWGLAWDVHNTWYTDARRKNPAEFVRRNAQRALMVHVKAMSILPELGESPLPWEMLLSAVRDAGLAGPVSIETHVPKGVPADPADVTLAALHAVRKAWPRAKGRTAGKVRPDRTGEKRGYEDKPVGFVIVGLGLGHSRAQEFGQAPGCKLLGVCDLNEERAKKTGEAFHVPWTTTMDPWLKDGRVEVVFVSTPTGRHGEVSIRALEAGKHVLVTKPMEASLAACDEMIRAAEKAGRILAVDFEKRFTPSALDLRGAVRGKRFGRLLGAHASLKIQRTEKYFAANGGWRGTKKLDGGGVLSNQSIHTIDKLAYCLGIPARVQCTTWTQHHRIEAEDLGCAAWQYADGLVLQLFATSSYPQDTWYDNLEIFGTEGAYLELDGGPFDRMTRWFTGKAWVEQAPEPAERRWVNAMDNLAAAIRTGAELVCSARDGRQTQAILDAVYRSAGDGGGWVDVE